VSQESLPSLLGTNKMTIPYLIATIVIVGVSVVMLVYLIKNIMENK